MSSSPASNNPFPHIAQNISRPLEGEAASNDQWLYLQERSSALLPFQDHKTCSGNSSLGNLNHHGVNSSLTKATIQYHTDCTSCMIPLEVSDNLCSGIHKSSTLLQVSGHDDIFSGELDPSVFVEEEYFSALAMCRDSEEFAEDRFNLLKDLHFPGPSGGDKTNSELDPVLLLYEQENPAVLQRKDIGQDGGSMDQSNAINYQKDISLSCCLESPDKLEPIMQDSSKSCQLGKRLSKEEINQYRFRLQGDKMELQPSKEGGSTSKKQQHNAKEKVRRMKLNASYLALASLLPNSQRSKKKWSAPGIIDKVLEYIPEVESEIEQLTITKNSMLSKNEGRQAIQQDLSEERQAPTISVHEVRQGEVIIQVCLQRRDQENAALSNLFQDLEEQSIRIVSASSINVCEESFCYHLHIKMDGNPLEADYLATLRKKLICWLN